LAQVGVVVGDFFFNHLICSSMLYIKFGVQTHKVDIYVCFTRSIPLMVDY